MPKRRTARPRIEELEARTVPAATLIKDVRPGADGSDPGLLRDSALVGDTLFFTAYDGSHGIELWKSDGTTAGTVLVKDINPATTVSNYGEGPHPRNLTVVGDTLFFVADDGTHGAELWKSDGTAAGTVMVKDIKVGSDGGFAGVPNPEFTALGDTLFFTANGGTGGTSRFRLWKSDGTTAGTVEVGIDVSADFPTVVGDNLLFFDGLGGLWKTDGTVAGSAMIKEFQNGPAGGYDEDTPAAVGGNLFFVADDGTNGFALWKSDGTAAGTVMVKDIDPATDGLSNIDNLTAVGDTLFFRSSNDNFTRTELWKSDGTAAGTVLVKDIDSAGGYGSLIQNLTDVGGTLFFAGNDGTNGLELWKSDGTAAGTVMVKDINPNTGFANSSFPENLTDVGGTLFFSAGDGNSSQLWKSDGTAAGTTVVADLSVNLLGLLTPVGDKLFLFASDPDAATPHGNELWAVTAAAAGPGPSVTDGVFSGSADGTFDAAVVTFDRAIDAASFTAADVSITGPGGTAIPATGVTLDDGTGGTRFSIAFDPQTTAGTYTIKIGPDVLDADGNAMDQNGNGTNGEAGDAFTTTGTLAGTPGPKVTNGGFAGPAGTFEAAVVTFDRAIDAASFTAADVTITGPGGSAIPVNGVTLDAGTDNRFSISFDPRTAPGTYTITVGPNVLDLAGNQMDQNDNGTNGEAGDVFTVSDTIAATGGPTVTSGVFSGAAAKTFDAVVVEFSTAIDAASFTADDVTITGPGGAPVAVTGVTLDAGTDNRFSIAFDPRTAPGTYTVTVGPNVSDAAGNLMNQDGDGTNGEAADAFTTTGTIEGTTGVAAPLALGASDGSVRIIDAANGNTVVSNFRPLDVAGSSYSGIVQVALGDLNGDGTADLLAAAANPAGAFGLDASKAGRVFVYDGASLLAGGTPALIRTFTPFATTDGPAGNTAPYVNGLNIAAADVDGDGQIDLIAGTRGNTATAGNREYGRLVVVNAGTDADGSDDSTIGSILKPFGNGYEKGVVVAGGDTDGDGKAEVAVTRGGPVAPTNPNKTVKLKAYRLANDGLAELNLSGQTDDAGNPRPFAPFAGITGAGGSVIERDARVAFVDPDGDGKAALVFTALDRITDPANTQVRVALFTVDPASGLATLASNGGGAAPTSYLVGSQVVDHAIAHADVNRDGSEDLALVTESASSGVQFLDPVTGAVRAGGFGLTILTGGITVDSF